MIEKALLEKDIQSKPEDQEFKTNLNNWTLDVDNGRSTWQHVENHIPTFAERYWTGLPLETASLPSAQKPQQAIENSWDFLRQLAPGGIWGANCDGPLFVTSGMVMAMYIIGEEIEPNTKKEMCRYLINTANDDGGWGTFLEDSTNVFGTSMNYIMLRMLGLSSKHPVCVRARNLIASMGSVLATQTWGKFWLCILGLYDWEGIIPLSPELMLLPEMLPVSPAKWWLPIRVIFTSMSYLYGNRFVMKEDALIRELRSELYDVPYESINWSAQRTNVSKTDRKNRKTGPAYHFAASALGVVERFSAPFRKRALKEALFQIEAEVINGGYLCCTPVAWASNIIVLWHAHGSESDWVVEMKKRFMDPMWMCREGLAASGTDGTACWDTSLVVQAVCGSSSSIDLLGNPDSVRVLKSALDFLDNAQIRQDCLGVSHTYRQSRRGGWPFSTREQGYIISDTTAEALRAVLHLQRLLPDHRRISLARLQLAVDALLAMESSGGGFGAYEQVRASEYLEMFNMTDAYESCMTEVRYPECTGSVVMALVEFGQEYPEYRTSEIAQCMQRSVSYLLHSQYEFGGWLGSWGVCFSYATMFALQALAYMGRTEKTCSSVAKACRFLLDVQNEDGGWGESLESRVKKVYVQETTGSQVPNTAYAVISLLAAQCSDKPAIEKGVAFLIRKQQPAGDWLPGSIEGIYTPPAGYRYPLYKFHFTIRALSMYQKRCGNSAVI